jgi:hypothetical protein
MGKGMEPEKLWIPEEVGSLLHCPKKSDQRQCGTRSPERMRRDCGSDWNAKLE